MQRRMSESRTRKSAAKQLQLQRRQRAISKAKGGTASSTSCLSRTRRWIPRAVLLLFSLYCLVVVPYFVLRQSADNAAKAAANDTHQSATATANKESAAASNAKSMFHKRMLPNRPSMSQSAAELQRISSRLDNMNNKVNMNANSDGNNDADTNVANVQDASTINSCDFRRYPRRRYYKLNEQPMPDFLETAEYIYGQLPTLLEPESSSMGASKLCVDQSEWLNADNAHNKELPFADGTNPSLLSLQNPITRSKIDPAVLQMFPPNVKFLATICMTNSQCAWRDTPQEQAEYHSSTLAEPTTVRTVLLFLDASFRTIQETTIRTQMDAPFGRKHKRAIPDATTQYALRSFALDDARLFTNRGDIWVSYREGKAFGYDKQVLNKLHFDKDLRVVAKASETSTFCCGRNMALIDNVHTNELQSLKWVDPVVVEAVDDAQGPRPAAARTNRRRLSLQGTGSTIRPASRNPNYNPIPSGHRRLRELHAQPTKKSDFHGTNGMMVYLPQTDEYLGMGHFHRPPGRKENEFARFGHHYTHAFFTIPAQPPFRLQRLSTEFVLPSHAYADDAEIIQFMSGLELVEDKHVVIAYGINDCEGAAVIVSMDRVDGMLRDVEEGKEVVDLMQPLQTQRRL